MRCIQDCLGRAIVLFQLYNSSPRVIALKVQYVCIVSTTPAIYICQSSPITQIFLLVPSNIFTSLYCEALVSWYSSIKMYLKCFCHFREFQAFTNRRTVSAIKSSKSNAAAWRRIDLVLWKYQCSCFCIGSWAVEANSSGETRSFLALLIRLTIARGENSFR